MSADEWRDLSEKYDRRSGGESKREKNKPIEREIEEIKERKEKSSDYIIGSKGYIEDVTRISKKEGAKKALEFIDRDLSQHAGELNRISDSKKKTFVDKLSELTMQAHYEEKGSYPKGTIGFHRTSNNNDTLFSNIDALSSLAGKYTNDKSLTNWLVFMYIRQFNKDYTTSTWDMAGGRLDSKFIEYVKKENSELAKYFGDSVNIIDPGSNEKIEITHWAAVLSVLTHDTTWSDAGIKSWAGEGNIDNLGGWAGDLQTLIIDVLRDTKNSNDYKILYKSASALMGDPDKSFSMTDLLADVDAVNINDSLGSSSLGSVMKSYYDSGYKTRYTSFVKSITGSAKKKSLNSLAGKYTDDWFLWPAQKWPLLSGVDVSSNQSKAVRDAFTDFIWNKVQGEK